jgi:hypothetical protein
MLLTFFVQGGVEATFPFESYPWTITDPNFSFLSYPILRFLAFPTEGSVSFRFYAINGSLISLPFFSPAPGP